MFSLLLLLAAMTLSHLARLIPDSFGGMTVSVSSSFCIFYKVFNFCFHIFNFQEMVSVLLSVLFL